MLSLPSQDEQDFSQNCRVKGIFMLSCWNANCGEKNPWLSFGNKARISTVTQQFFYLPCRDACTRGPEFLFRNVCRSIVYTSSKLVQQLYEG